MNLDFFPDFVRAVNPAAGQFSNGDLLGLGVEFQKYLDNLDLLPEVRAAMVSIDLLDVIPRMSRMGYVKGYHAALVWHFSEWIRGLMDKAGVSVTKAPNEN